MPVRIELSLIMCFRKRVEFFNEMLRTLISTAHDPTRLELIVAMDTDDTATRDAIAPTLRLSPIRSLVVSYPHSDLLIKTHLNPAAKRASGRWFLGVSDDLRFVTHNWDQLIINSMSYAADSVCDDIWLGMPDDALVHNRCDFTCWPVTSKQAHDALGYWYNERFFFWGADHHIGAVYRTLGRVVDLRHVLLNHYTYHNGQRAVDENYHRFHALTNTHGCVDTRDILASEVLKLTEVMNDRKT